MANKHAPNGNSKAPRLPHYAENKSVALLQVGQAEIALLSTTRELERDIGRGLSYRNPTVQFTYRDYQTYEHQRDRLLLGPRGRAALKAGGIVWRLACFSVSIDHALQGPSFTSSTKVVATSNGIDYVDDVLDELDLDQICGVNFIFNRK